MESGIKKQVFLKSAFMAHISRGFTFVEALVAVLVGCMLLVVFQTFFSQGVRSSMKGMDTLESIRSAGQLFAQMRKDLRGCENVETGTALQLTVAQNTLPDLTSYISNTVLFGQRTATTTYLLQPMSGGGNCVVREVRLNGALTSTTKFAVPRMKKFAVTKISKQQRVKAGQEVFDQDQLLVQIEVDSNDPRFPSGKISLSTFFVTGQMSETAWWNYYFPVP